MYEYCLMSCNKHTILMKSIFMGKFRVGTRGGEGLMKTLYFLLTFSVNLKLH